MDFRFTTEQDAFRAEVAGFLQQTLTPSFWEEHREKRLPGWSPEFSMAAAERGWLGIAWPEEYGGQAKGPVEQTIYMEEMALAGAPQEHHRRAVQQVGPSIMTFGSPEQKQTYLPGITSAKISFAMGLSEPNAGSDLAGVETTAIRDGDEYVLNGLKRYTSGAHYSDFLWCVARTDPEAPKHRGISMMVVPLDAAGVSVEPLYDLQGRHHFNHVRMEDVRIPAANLVGEENRGWYINAQTMDFERAGGAHIGGLRRSLALAVRYAQSQGTATVSASTRLRLADCAVAVQVARFLSYRVAWQRSRGESPNHEASMVKLTTARIRRDIADAMMAYAGMGGLRSAFDDTEDLAATGLWGPEYLDSISAPVAQGTAEIQRNVIATRGLGLPRS